MKIVTNDYGCGTSSSILDYGINDVLVVSEDNWQHLLEADDDLFFVGHDFLLYLWDTQEKVHLWKQYPHSKLVWCFEPIDALFQEWRQKSHYAIGQASQFADEIFSCHEPDADNYGFRWLPQWASPKFFEQKHYHTSQGDKILFSGQAGKPEYKIRNDLLVAMQSSDGFKDRLVISNVNRNLSWYDYIANMLSYEFILNPYGILNAFNTRAYEVLYSGRVLLQQTPCEYRRHFELLNGHDNVITFKDFAELEEKLKTFEPKNVLPDIFYADNNIYSRFKSIGIDIE